MRKEKGSNMGKGRQPATRVKLPDGWPQQLFVLCRIKWKINTRPFYFKDMLDKIKFSPNTFLTAKKKNELTEERFYILMEALEYTDAAKFILDLSLPRPIPLIETSQNIYELDVADEDGLLRKLIPQVSPGDGGRPSAQSGSELSSQIVTNAPDAIPPEIKAEMDRSKLLMDADKHSEAIPILEAVRDTADIASHTVARIKIRLSLGHAFWDAHEDIQSAEQQFRDALALVPADRADLRHNVLHGLGDMLLLSGRIDESKAAIQAAFDVAIDSKDTGDLARSLISQSLLERQLGLHDSAVSQLDNAIQLLLRHNLSPMEDDRKANASAIAVCYINKAFLSRESGNIDEALAFCAQAEGQHKVSGDKLDAARALLFCGETHCANANWGAGYECFQRALGIVSEISNPLWSARIIECIARLHATHENWEDACEAMLAATKCAEESRNSGEVVKFLCLSSKFLRKLITSKNRNIATRKTYMRIKQLPESKRSDAYARWNTESDKVFDEIDVAVREDAGCRTLLERAKEIAEREKLHVHLANCLLDEVRFVVPRDDNKLKQKIIKDAIEHLKTDFRKATSPKHQARTIGRISVLYRDLGNDSESMSWLKKAGELYEKFGDINGVANYYCSLGEVYHSNNRPDEEIAAYRKVLSLIEGRSFHDLAAGTRINLASALQIRDEFGEARKLLDEAEQICDRHKFKNYIPAIARNRSAIERRVSVAQSPTMTLPELLGSLHQLYFYRRELALAYLSFWYSTFQTQLLAAVRSGPMLSFMVVTNDASQFLKYAKENKLLADHFLMVTSETPEIEVEARVLPIPPEWLFPPTFTFVGMRKVNKDGEAGIDGMEPEDIDFSNAKIEFEGPASEMPPYIMIQEKSAVKGEGHVMAMSSTYLPQTAISLMIDCPIVSLIDHSAVWMPFKRWASKDPMLTDLRIAHEFGIFPVYFGRFPISDDVLSCGSAQISIPSTLLDGDQSSIKDRWRRALLKLAKLPKEQAQLTLIDLPEMFSVPRSDGVLFEKIEIHLFEFKVTDRRVCHPAFLVRRDQ
jgi:tetratricopeptide (TPR) repeat protein